MKDRPFLKEFFSVDGDIVSLRLLETIEGNGDELPFYWWSIMENATGANIGKISLRLGHNYHSYWNGNVGYEVDEPFRGHHYAAIALRPGLMTWIISLFLVMRTTPLRTRPSNVAAATFSKSHIRPKIGFITGPAFL